MKKQYGKKSKMNRLKSQSELYDSPDVSLKVESEVLKRNTLLYFDDKNILQDLKKLDG